MQARECRFHLPAGRKCRAAATRNQPFCRHHGPKAARPGPPPLPKSERYSRLAHWSWLGRSLPWLDPSEIPGEVWMILSSLLEDGTGGISDRVAGRLLRALLRRHGSVPFPVPAAAAAPEPAPEPSPEPAAPSPLESAASPHGPQTKAVSRSLSPEEIQAIFSDPRFRDLAPR